MNQVVKIVRFNAAHMLSDYPGLCQNLHGHTYRLEVAVDGMMQSKATDGTNNITDMVIDFKALKHIIEEYVLSVFDHSFIYDETSPIESDIALTVAKHGLRTVALPYRSTSENLAHRIYELLSSHVPGLVSVKIWESSDSSAEYRK